MPDREETTITTTTQLEILNKTFF